MENDAKLWLQSAENSPSIGPAHEPLLVMILTNRLRGRLDESRLAEDLDHSAADVKQALRRLEYDGVLVRGSDEGFAVREVGVKEYEECVFMRTLVESRAAASAAGAVPQEKIAAVRRSLEASWTPQASMETLWRLDDAMHDLAADHCGNPVMASIIRTLRPAIRLYDTHHRESRRTPERIAASHAEHLAILDALERGDGDGARQAMLAHVTSVGRMTKDSEAASQNAT